MNKPWELMGTEDAFECVPVRELAADVATVTLDAAKKECSRDEGDPGPTCVGTLKRTGLKAVVRDVVDHVYEVSNCG